MDYGIASHLKHFSNLTHNAIFEILDPPVQGFLIFVLDCFVFSLILYIGAVFKPIQSFVYIVINTLLLWTCLTSTTFKCFQGITQITLNSKKIQVTKLYD